MIPLVLPGRAKAARPPRDTRTRLAAFGEDLIAAVVLHLSPERLPGVTGPGAAIGPISPLAARRDEWGRVAQAHGRGATLAEVGGRPAALTTTGVLSTDARPTDRTSFGIGMLYNFNAGALAGSADHMGNSESTGVIFPAAVNRAVGSASDQLLRWQGITNSWITARPADVQAGLRVEAPGWYILAVDDHGGNSGLALDRRDPVVAPGSGITPTLSSIRFGGSSDTPTGLGAVAAFIVCDGPLVQDAGRLNAWRDFCDAVLEDIRA